MATKAKTKDKAKTKAKAKGLVENTEKEIKEKISGLRAEVTKLSDQVKDKLKGATGEMKETAENLTREIKVLSDKVRELMPGRKKQEGGMPVLKEATPPVGSDFYVHPLVDFHQQVRRMFDDFYRDFDLLGKGWQGSRWPQGKFWQQPEYPKMDFAETEKEITVTAELPGVNREELQVTVSDDMLTIKGEKRQEKEEGKGRYHRTECYYGSFQRSFSLPCEVESQKVEASFENGVLVIKMPKSKAARQKIKHISIR